MFVLSYVSELCIYPRFFQNHLDKPVCFTHANVLLSYVSELYLLGNLPFFKIHVNHFVARDNSPGAKVISKCMLWVRGLVLFSSVLRHFLSLIKQTAGSYMTSG